MKPVVVVGAGPAGLMAADTLSAAGIPVRVLDRMPSLGRKFLMAGRGGLNLTHSEDLVLFLPRYSSARAWLEPMIHHYPPSQLIAFADQLGQATFIGSSGRVFPKAMKASPLLRAWLRRLDSQGVVFTANQRLVAVGDDNTCLFQDPSGAETSLAASAVVLALGGGSWARLGSDGAWTGMVRNLGVDVRPLEPANGGVTVAWSEHMRTRFAGQPLKRIAISVDGQTVRGEAMITTAGLEGGAIYALSSHIRGRLHAAASTPIELNVDLKPDMSEAELIEPLRRAKAKLSTSTWLRRVAALSPAAIALLQEVTKGKIPGDPTTLARLLKAVPIAVTGLAPIDRAISTAGGIPQSEVDANLMLRKRPGVFVAGEMLDWEAPTGGYLLQACFATGVAAGEGALAYVRGQTA